MSSGVSTKSVLLTDALVPELDLRDSETCTKAALGEARAHAVSSVSPESRKDAGLQRVRPDR